MGEELYLTKEKTAITRNDMRAMLVIKKTLARGMDVEIRQGPNGEYRLIELQKRSIHL